MSWSRIVTSLAAAAALWIGGCASGRVGAPGAPGVADSEPAPPSAVSTPSTAAESSPATAYVGDQAALDRASQLFRAVCTGYCHTTEGTGREAPDLFDCDSRHGSSDRDVFAVVSAGVPNTQMQAFGGKLPDEDLWRIVAYLRANSKCS